MKDDYNDVVLAMDIGGSKARVGLVLRDGSVTTCVDVGWSTEGDLASDLAQLARAVSDVHDKARLPNDLWCGIGHPGSFEGGRVVMWPNRRWWEGFDFRDWLEGRLHGRVVLGGDVQVAAMAERRWGSCQACPNFVYVSLGTGIGAALVVNGRVYRGWRGWAGEFGHTTIAVDGPRCRCGKCGCLQAIGSGAAIARLAAERLPGEEWTTEGVFEAARRGDEGASAIVAEAGSYIGIGLANLVELLDPEAIVLGGGLMGASDVLMPSISNSYYRHRRARLPDIGVSRFGASAGIIGAAALAYSAVEGYAAGCTGTAGACQ